MRSLEESVDLHRRMADKARSRAPHSGARHEQIADSQAKSAAVIHELLLKMGEWRPAQE